MKFYVNDMSMILKINGLRIPSTFHNIYAYSPKIEKGSFEQSHPTSNPVSVKPIGLVVSTVCLVASLSVAHGLLYTMLECI
uniref:Uncharacterized protein n=1 Tax=Glossina palpalis gambiensis TaxID=67801 RepID=A0A1B0AXB1_9MUSC